MEFTPSIMICYNSEYNNVFLPVAVEDKKVFEFSDYFFGMIIEQSEVRSPNRDLTGMWLYELCCSNCTRNKGLVADNVLLVEDLSGERERQC